MASETIYYGSKSLIEIGNVGIRTKTPVTALDVVGSIRQSALPVLYVYSIANQTITTATAITFATTNYNTQWTLTSTSRFTLTGPSGYYLIWARLYSSTAFASLGASIRVNGTERAVSYSTCAGPTGTNSASIYSEIVWLLNTNDFIEVFGVPSVSTTIQSASDTRTAFQAVYLSGTT
jgi:hypothetical protein